MIYYNIGDRVRLDSDHTELGDGCVIAGEVYTVIYVSSFGGITLDHCSNQSRCASKMEGDRYCYQYVEYGIDKFAKWAVWSDGPFEPVYEPFSIEELKTALTFEAFSLENVGNFFR